MPGKRHWQCFAASLLIGGMLLAETAAGLTAPSNPSELSLDDSIAIALKNNPSIKMAALDKEKAEWSIREAEAGKWPTLSLAGDQTYASAAAPGVLAGDSGGVSLHATWPLYTGGRTEGLIEQARLNADIANQGIAKAISQLRLDTTTAYYNALQARNMVKVNQETVDNLAEHLKNVEAQYAAGTVAKADVLQTEVQLANAQQNLTKAQNDYDVAEATLNKTIGLPMGARNILKNELTYVKYDKSLDESIQMALKNRPEVFQAKASIDAAEAGVKVAGSNRLPTISLTGADGWSGNSFPGQDNSWTLSLTASWDIFDAGLTKAKVKEAQTAVDTAIQSDIETRQELELNVRQAYLSMKEAERRIETSRVAVDKAQEDLKIARTKYYAGAGTNLDVIDAQLALTQAETNYTQALYDYNTNKVKLEEATGVNIR